MAQRKESKTERKIRQLNEEAQIANIGQNRTRARSLTIGTTTGGIVEVHMRGDFSSLWYLLNPVEAVEIMQQFAAACGVEIAMRPKQDFSTWRSWDLSLPGETHWIGAAPWQLSNEQRQSLSGIQNTEVKLLNNPPSKDTETNEPKEPLGED
jgi:hypothetical protein